jgi:3-oxoacyl-[acyl-carrier protein] reductase
MARPLPPDGSLASRHALVCGASAGIGRAAALALAGRGAWVTALARRREALERLVPDLLQAGASRADCIVADMDDRGGLESRVATYLVESGPVHVLVHNTGGPKSGALLEATEADLLAAIGRILLSAHLLVRLVLPGMRNARYGRIVTVLSSSVREPIPNLGVGNTVRGAMAGWTKTISGELPPGVTMNNVLPGATGTERLASIAAAMAERTGRTVEDVEAQWRLEIPEGRIGDPAEIGAVIAFLASPEASYVRGQSLAVDGGRMRGI